MLCEIGAESEWRSVIELLSFPRLENPLALLSSKWGSEMIMTTTQARPSRWELLSRPARWPWWVCAKSHSGLSEQCKTCGLSVSMATCTSSHPTRQKQFDLPCAPSISGIGERIDLVLSFDRAIASPCDLGGRGRIRCPRAGFDCLWSR